MSAGEAEAASAVGAFAGPGNVLNFAAFYRFADVWVSLMLAVGAAHGTFGWDGRENGTDALHAVAEAHVEVPFVPDCEWLNAVGDGMFWE